MPSPEGGVQVTTPTGAARAGSTPGATPPTAASPAHAVDRYLCSYSHLSPGFARYVLAELTGPSLRATAPAFGVDLIALARHATVSCRRIRLARLLLTGDLGLLLVSVLVVIASSTTAARATGAVGLVIGVIFPHLIVLVTLISAHGYAQRANTVGVSLRDNAPPLSAKVEQRLDELMNSNAVVFRGGFPFEGYGLPLGSWKVEVDVTKPGTDSNGDLRQLRPFNTAELHKELTRTVRNAPVPDLRAHHRIFVGGTGTAKIPSLLPDPLDRPSARVTSDTIRLGIERPGQDARTYLCLEKISWDGELVVNLLIRAAQLGGDLFVEGHAFVLLPIRSEMCALDRVASNQVEVLWFAFRDTLRSSWGQLLHSPLYLMQVARLERQRSRLVAADRRKVQRRQAFDRGAGIGIRSLAADNERVYLFAYADEEMILNSMRRRVLAGIEKFLDDRGVDTTPFVQARSNIVNNNYSIQNALANAMSIGTGGSANSFGPAAIPPTGGQPAGTTQPSNPSPPPWTNTP
jgi:hypothetical protein